METSFYDARNSLINSLNDLQKIGQALHDKIHKETSNYWSNITYGGFFRRPGNLDINDFINAIVKVNDLIKKRPDLINYSVNVKEISYDLFSKNVDDIYEYLYNNKNKEVPLLSEKHFSFLASLKKINDDSKILQENVNQKPESQPTDFISYKVGFFILLAVIAGVFIKMLGTRSKIG